MNGQASSDMDGGWKQAIEDFLEEFFQFFFPLVHASIDFSQKCRFLDKELAKLVPGAASGKREVDKLIQVHWKNGGTDLILVHVEVQAQGKPDFAQRMCVYNCRIWDRYNKPVVSLALLVDGDPGFRPDQYCRQIAGCRLEFTYPIVKLLEFKSEEELIVDPSPFAVASLVQLRKLQAGPDVHRRYVYKVALVRELYHRDYSRDHVLKLLRFMDYIMTLPAELAIQFRGELERIEEELKMPYLTTWEQSALEKGRAEGIEEGIEKGIEKGIAEGRMEGIRQGVIEALCQTLEVRFGTVPEPLLTRIEQCKSVDQLHTLHKLALTAQTLEELQF